MYWGKSGTRAEAMRKELVPRREEGQRLKEMVGAGQGCLCLWAGGCLCKAPSSATVQGRDGAAGEKVGVLDRAWLLVLDLSEVLAAPP